MRDYSPDPQQDTEGRLHLDLSLSQIALASFLIGSLLGAIFGGTLVSNALTGSPAGFLTTTEPAGTATADIESQDATISSAELPSKVTLPYTWQNIGPKLVESGAVNLTRLQLLHKQRGTPLTAEQLAFFTDGTDEQITISRENSKFLLNTFWAFGITNKNPLLEDGRMEQLVDSGQANRLAATGGWPLGTRSGGELLNSAQLVALTPEQQQRVDEVAKTAYRPCCNNPTAFPDCNHGAAALGLIELMAAQGASTEEIRDAVKAANAMWFPQKYWELAVYFEEVKGQDWSDVDAETVLSKEYSSASGWMNIHRELQQNGLLPETGGGGASCGV